MICKCLLFVIVVLSITMIMAEPPLSSFVRNDPFKELYYASRINTLNPLITDTYQQRYFLDDSAHITGNPIFLMLGGEAALEYYWFSSGGSWRAMANKAQAVKLWIEHPYYGKSQPYDGKKLENLSTEGALENAMRILVDVIRKYPTKDGSKPKVVVAGGSLSGMYAAMASQRYPHLIDGAIASSAPFGMIGQEFSLTPLNYKYFYHVTEDYYQVNPDCPNIVRQAFDQLDTYYTNKNYTIIQNTLNTCGPVKDDANYEQLIGWVRSAFIDFAQGNNPSDNAAISWPVQKACQILLKNRSNPLAGVRGVVDLAFSMQNNSLELQAQHPKFWRSHSEHIFKTRESLGGTRHHEFRIADIFPILQQERAELNVRTGRHVDNACHDIWAEWSNCVDTSGCGTGDEAVSWDYQACTQVVYYPSCDCTCMFPSFFHGLKEVTQYCKAHYGVDTAAYSYNRLGVSFPSTNWDRAANILFTNFDQDPWCDGYAPTTSTINNPTILALAATKVSHHYDLNTPLTTFKVPDIDALREFEYQVVQEFIAPNGPSAAKMEQFKQTIREKWPAKCYPSE